jgi:hypothetical protein
MRKRTYITSRYAEEKSSQPFLLTATFTLWVPYEGPWHRFLAHKLLIELILQHD